MTEYAFHPEALQDLEEIWDYIALDSSDAANQVVSAILVEIEQLSSFPLQGHRRPDLTSRPVRFQVIRDFLVAYAPDERPLWILAILHGRRNPRVLAALLRDRD